MAKLKSNIGGIVMCLFEIMAGILLLVNPVIFTSGIIVALGIVLLVIGLLGVISYFRMEPAEAAMKQTLAKGLAVSAAGLFCIVQYQWFVESFSILAILYGVIILTMGFSKIQWAVDMLRMEREKWFLAAIGALLSVVAAVVILMNPFSSTKILWMFVGVSLILQAAVDIMALVSCNQDSKPDEAVQK
ncbi:hypothetical protein D7V82_09570 [bacterium 1xD8-6]|jgi:Uncharacterized conserved protein|nr:hypothetical protein D7V72_11570 [bacterium D16-36]RKI69507.1 hypothetical protein D7V82_09570 [bacterium 1xD8-6]